MCNDHQVSFVISTVLAHGSDTDIVFGKYGCDCGKHSWTIRYLQTTHHFEFKPEY